MDARAPGADDGGGRPPDVLVGPTAPNDPWDFETPTTWEAGNEVWSFDLRAHHDAALPDHLWSDLPRVLALEWVAEDAPWLAVRTAALVAGTKPVQQDFCVATAMNTNGWSDGLGRFAVVLGATEVDLGQPWTWDRLEIAGTRTEIGLVDDLVVTGRVGATELAAAAFGATGDPCARLAYEGLACVPCDAIDGWCVDLDLSMFGQRENAVLVEPIATTDVALNPACDEG